jgi:hypothetical protein
MTNSLTLGRWWQQGEGQWRLRSQSHPPLLQLLLLELLRVRDIGRGSEPNVLPTTGVESRGREADGSSPQWCGWHVSEGEADGTSSAHMVCLSRVAEGLVRALVSETDVGVALALGYDKSLLRRWTRHTETSLRHKVYRTSPKPVGSNLPPSSSNGHCTFLASLNAFASATCAYA